MGEYITTEKLIEQLQEKFDEKIFEKIIKRFEPLFKKSFSNFKIFHFEMDDYRQEGRIVLFEAIDSYELSDGQRFAPYFHVIYKNRIYNIKRSLFAQKRGSNYYDMSLIQSKNYDSEDEYNVLDYVEDSYNVSPYEWIEVRDAENRYAEILSPLERKVFRHYLDDKNLTEIALILKLEYGTIKSAIDRCRHKLKHLLEK